jgi:hypothetical protein
MAVTTPKNRCVEIKIKLPDNVVQEAKESGLLTPKSIEAMLRAELRRRRAAHLFETADRLASLDMQPLTNAEVEVEIQAARSTKRLTNAHRR